MTKIIACAAEAMNSGQAAPGRPKKQIQIPLGADAGSGCRTNVEHQSGSSAT
jgi:hypothetical protein